MKRLFAAILVALILAAPPAAAQRLVTQVSSDTVEITSSFDGERLTFFGQIGPEAGADPSTVQGPYQVVIVVVGPTQTRVARQKSNIFGVWLNTDQVEFNNFPSYFHVLSSARLRDISDVTTLTTNRILPEAHIVTPTQAGWWKTAVFGRQLVRLMTEERLFGVQENGVQFLADNFYSARLTLPSHAPPGPYLALTYVFKNGEIVARRSEGFAVRKIGFERFLAISAVQYPLAYGVICVLLALTTGWLGGVVFRR